MQTKQLHPMMYFNSYLCWREQKLGKAQQTFNKFTKGKISAMAKENANSVFIILVLLCMVSPGITRGDTKVTHRASSPVLLSFLMTDLFFQWEFHLPMTFTRTILPSINLTADSLSYHPSANFYITMYCLSPTNGQLVTDHNSTPPSMTFGLFIIACDPNRIHLFIIYTISFLFLDSGSVALELSPFDFIVIKTVLKFQIISFTALLTLQVF